MSQETQMPETETKKSVEEFEPVQTVEADAVLDDSDFESDKIRKRILELRGNVEESNFELAERLYFVYANQLYRKWNFGTWDEYAEQEVGIGIRKANYLKKIWEWFAIQVNDKELFEEIKKLGWTRAMLLTGIVNGSNKEKWLSIARNMSCKELEEEIKLFKKSLKDDKKVDDETDIKHRLSVDLYNEQVVIVQEAMERAGELANTEVKGQQLAAICQDYVATNEWMKDSKKNTGAYFAKFENLLGLRFVVIDPRTKEIVYGKAFMDDVQQTSTN